MGFPLWTVRSSSTTHETVCGRFQQPEAHNFSRVYFTLRILQAASKSLTALLTSYAYPLTSQSPAIRPLCRHVLPVNNTAHAHEALRPVVPSDISIVSHDAKCTRVNLGSTYNLHNNASKQRMW